MSAPFQCGRYPQASLARVCITWPPIGLALVTTCLRFSKSGKVVLAFGAESLLVSPPVPVRSPELEADAAELGRLISSLGGNVERLLRTHQKEIVDRQYLLGRVSDAATEIYVSSCVLNRLDHLIRHSHDDGRELMGQLETGRFYLRNARRRIKRSLADLWDNDDEQTTALAKRMLKA